MLITIENIGNVPIILDEYGREFAKKNIIMTDIQEFIVNKDEFIMIKPNEAKLVTYKYNFGCPFKENYSKICNSLEYQSLKLKILWGIIIYKYRGIKLFVIAS